MNKNFRTMVEHSIQGIVIIQDFRIVYANQAFVKMTGFTKKELHSLTPSQVQQMVHPDYQDLVWDRMRDRFEGKKVIPRYEYKGCRKDGTVRWLEMVANRIEYEGKRAILGAIIDITERKKTEEALQKSQANLMALIENSQASVWSVDRDFRLLTINSQFKKMFTFAYGVDLKVGMKITDCISPKMKRTWVARYNRAFRGESFVIEEDFTIAGKTINTEISFNPIRNNGEITGVSVFSREITEQKRAQENHRESEERYKRIIDLAPDGIVTADLKGVITSCNSAFLKQTGLSRDVIVGKHFSKMPGLFKSDISAYLKVIASLVKGKSVRSFEARWKRADGIVRWGEIRVAPLKRGRKITGLQAITRDITERKHTDIALKENEARYMALFNRSLYGVFLHDFEGKFLDANKAALNMLGYSKEDISSLNFASLLSEDQLPMAFKGIEVIIKEGYQKKPTVYRLRRKDGTHMWVETEATLISKGGEPHAIQGIARDITEQKQAEEALRESEEKYRAIFESFHDVYYRTDREGLVTIISPSVRTHAGWDPEDIIGHPVTDFYKDPSERETFKEKLKESGVINDYELRLLAKDGRVIDVSVSSKIIFGKDGKPTGVEGVLRDITDRKHAEEQVKSSLKEKEVLLQEIHHRVKNNMQIISSLLNLQSRHIEDYKVKDMFKMSRDRIRSMALIHEKLYQSEDLSKINFAQYIRSLTVHLMNTYNASVDKIKLDAEVADVFLDINKAIPCGLIVNELVSNSLKHAFPLDKRGNIHIQLSTKNNGTVCLVVRDDGIGFTKQVNFQKPDSLGLQLVNDLVEQLGGTLELDLNGGTSYQISFSA